MPGSTLLPGKLYAVLGRYSGRVLSDEMQGTSILFMVFGFSIASFGHAKLLRRFLPHD